MGLSELFRSSETRTETHSWNLVSHDPTVQPVDALAAALAELIMEHRCRGCGHHYRAWRARVLGGSSVPESSRDALRAFIAPVFGLPEDPASVPQDHMEGFVAQYLWYFLALEMTDREAVERVEPPAFKATDPGGDGLAIHRIGSGRLMFRLWEIKKCAGERARVSSTVSTAYSQLGAKATEYLARYTAIGQEFDDPELADFYGQLIELWVDARPEAAAGVSVATSKAKVPRRCFTTFGKRFPEFVEPVRLRGMLTAIDDFSHFAVRVRAHIWSGL
jgi:hypothetical protein